MRNTAVDISKGICILLMVLGHCPIMTKYTCAGIESFHMPFFFIVSGFFYRPKEITEVISSGVRRLLVPLLIGALICVGIKYLMSGQLNIMRELSAFLYPGGTRAKDIIAPKMPDLGVFWFLAALFWCKLFYAIIDRYKPTSIHVHIIAICALLSWGFITIAPRLIFPFCITEGMSGLVFYALGHEAAQQRKICELKFPWFYYIVFILLWLIEIRFVKFRMWQCDYTLYLYPLGVCFACGMSWIVYQIGDRLKTLHAGELLRFVGRYSLEFMCCHQIIRTFVAFFVKLYPVYNTQMWLTCMFIVGTIILSSLYVFVKIGTVKIIKRDKIQ